MSTQSCPLSPDGSTNSRFKVESRSPEKNDPLYVDNLVTTNGGVEAGVDMDKVSTTPAAPSPAPPISSISATPDSNVEAGNHDTGEQPDDDQLLKSPHDGSGEAPTNLFLYQDEFGERPRISKVLNSISNYSSTIQNAPDDPNAKAPEKANLGTLMGVYLPCLQNIFGVILFIRMTWLVGTCGAVEGFLVILICCCTTMLTAISMSAIATNGVVPAGGSYFMISRSLGPEFGGAVGICFYIGTTVAGAMYIIGAVEIGLKYLIGAQMSLFGPDLNDDSVVFNNYRVYGTILLFIMGTIVFFGVQIVNKFASLALVCVLGTIVCMFTGIIWNYNGNDLANICVVGTRLVEQVSNCTKHHIYGEELWNHFCERLDNATDIEFQNMTSEYDYKCDEYFSEQNVTYRRGIKGIASGTFSEAMWNTYHEGGDVVSDSWEESEYNLGGKSTHNYIIVDIYTSFTIIIGIFFPSVTGIMAGSNRSGDLADAQKSIPIGTIMAILTTGTVYLLSAVLFAATVDPLLLRDKFGQSLGGSLVLGNIAVPHPKVIEVGSFLSTFGAGLQSLTGAPRLLQSIAKDETIPFLKPMAVLSKSNEPTRALFVTLSICQLAVLIGNVDAVAPLLSMFFLMCYCFVNVACALLTLLKTPNWRPSFKYYHWSLSILGAILCISIMFMASWYFALIAVGISLVIYKYIEFQGAEKEWGDGIRGLALSAARFSLLRLEDGPPHTKNWRPQILILAKLDEKLNVKHKRLFTLASQLKAGKGLTIGATVVQGEYGKMFAESQAARVSLRQVINGEGVKGFPEVVVGENVSDCISHMVQTCGLGGMKPNTVILGWPNSWRRREDDSTKVFVDTIRNAGAGKMALLVPKGIQRFPDTGDTVKGFIDIWWIVHDGGLLMLLPFLLKQHRTWKKCRMRIFTVAQAEDNSIQMKKDLKQFLYQLRIEAEIDVIEMHDSDVSAYTYERTLIMEQRNEMLQEMKVTKSARSKMVDSILDPSRHHDLGISSQKSPSKVKFSEDVSADEVPRSDQNHTAAAGGGGDANHKKHEYKNKDSLNPENANVRRMHTAVKLNEAIVSRSHDAKLVILNLPGPPKTLIDDSDYSYMEFLEVLTEGLERVLMVRGGGREVITIYS